ncbi:MAG: hypothetical protein DHS20C01_34030 [marine bacterium B5-7]|nr:MAG: hypothetical protein DHS20C01_34030 [marine bacterium B5-7]
MHRVWQAQKAGMTAIRIEVDFRYHGGGVHPKDFSDELRIAVLVAYFGHSCSPCQAVNGLR